jgi:hypothetical protein
MTATPTLDAHEAEDVEYRRQENRVRAKARRQGLQLMKSRTRNREAVQWGTYMLVDPYTNTVAMGMPSGFGLSLDDIDGALNER